MIDEHTGDRHHESVPQRRTPGNFQKAYDGRGQPIRGLWERNGRYYARLTVENPMDGKKEVRRVPLEGVKTVAEAKKALNKLHLQRDNNDLPAVKRSPKFDDYAESYLQHLKTVVDLKRPATVAKERYALKHWREHLGSRRLHHINPATINAFIAKRQSAGVSGRTVNLDVIALRNVLRHAIDDGWITRLPTENLRPLKWTAPKRDLVTDADITAFCTAALTATKNGQQLADYVKLMAYSGARRNEALRLKWSDVNWERKQLTVGSDGLAKNRQSRSVDFNADLEAHLLDMQGRHASDSQFIFPSPQRGTKDIPAKSFIDSLNLTREAGSPKFNFHDCRHFFISMAVMCGIDYMTIARWVGHQDGGVLIGKVYGHLSNEHTQRQAKRLIFSPVALAISSENAA